MKKLLATVFVAVIALTTVLVPAAMAAGCCPSMCCQGNAPCC